MKERKQAEEAVVIHKRPVKKRKAGREEIALLCYFDVLCKTRPDAGEFLSFLFFLISAPYSTTAAVSRLSFTGPLMVRSAEFTSTCFGL
jgi:hypothetical protein